MSFNYSSIVDENLSRDDPLFWSRPTPVDCNTIRIMGIFLCIAAFIGIVFNGALFYSFVRYKTLRSPPNIFVMFIVGLGLIASCTILPLTGTSSVYCQWLYKRAGCQLSAIVAFLYGCSSSYLLCAASLSRCYIIVRPFQAKYITVNKCTIVSCIAIFIAFIWTMLPVMGWNEYTMEGARTSCCINWYDRRTSYIAFLFFLFIVVYCVPLIILIIVNTITMLGLKRMREKIENGIQTVFNRKRIEMERRILKSIIITTSGFAFTWTPYAVTLFVSAFRGKDYAISPMATFFCACFAKTSVIWIPMFYVFTSTQFQLNFINRNALDQSIGITRVDAKLANAPILPQKNGQLILKPVTENNHDT
ncbi:unnamed protein product [Rotaria sp. Silwood2]|nr:unnamed protein product [Rotaria sp. Silwood2]CAF2882759.1 unnamed protein product [Rotaria sp. Silwood2]CAF3308629.1 unnamed protein product [Rotaria sp. Silwood2]CAF4179909.1 unnamed protein product [Rotaria sp. Silwood2]CAF4325991.1 unnamed protein product [Rotaria sp. Silwood2]